jgi:hypothetical protein
MKCLKCIHKCVCKTAESCDGYVSGCKHFREENEGKEPKKKFFEMLEVVSQKNISKKR